MPLLQVTNKEEKKLFLSKFVEPVYSEDLETGCCFAVVFNPDMIHFGQRNNSIPSVLNADHKIGQVLFGSLKSISCSRKREQIIDDDNEFEKRNDYQYYPIALHTILGTQKKVRKIWKTDNNDI